MSQQEALIQGMGRRRALVIATSKFSERGLDDLPEAKNDLFELVPLLTDKGIGNFEVISLLNAIKSHAEKEIERIFKTEAESDDFLVLYITGHGVVDPEDSSSLWFALKDYRQASHRSSALEARWIRNILEASKARRQLIIIDTCYSGMFAESKTLAAQVGIEKLRGAQDAIIARRIADDSFRYYIFACGDDELAFADHREAAGSRLSRLTSVIVSSLRDGSADKDGDGSVSLDDLWEIIEERSDGWPDQRPRREVGSGGRVRDTFVALGAPRANGRSGALTPQVVGTHLRREKRKIRRRLFLKRHARSSIAVCGLVCAVLIAGTVYRVDRHVLPTETLQLTAARWQRIDTDGSTTFPALKDGVFEVSVPAGHLQWYGLYYPSPRSCDYTLRLDARHLGQAKPVNGMGWGYGISVRSTWYSSTSSAEGWTLQDEYSYQGNTLYGDVRITQLSNVNSSPYAPFAILPDNGWHTWAITVNGKDVTVKRGGETIGTFPLQDSCGGIFIRVWSETVQFRNISLTTP